MNKKYQVDINKIRSTDPYVSALTGIEYPSYFEYLNSDKEFTEPRTEGLGANVILATDSPGNVYKSPFFDVGIEFTPLTGIGGGTATQAQLEVSNAVKVLDSIEAPASTDARADIERRRQEELKNYDDDGGMYDDDYGKKTRKINDKYDAEFSSFRATCNYNTRKCSYCVSSYKCCSTKL